MTAEAVTRAGLELVAVGHSYQGREAVHEVSLTVQTGEIMCLLGPSGCGKTTVLRVAAGLETLQRGRVLIDGREVAGPRQALATELRGVGLMFQDFALFPHLKVIDNVTFGLAHLPSAERRARAEAELARVGMADTAGNYPHTLSGGEQQRVALARALAPEPRVMLLDEPFSGLDVRLRDRIRADTARLLRASGTTTLMVTHDPEEAMMMADRIALMRAGRIVQEGTPVELYRRPKGRFCADFLGETNRFEGLVRDGLVETALGPVPAPGLAEGEAVEVLVRPEGLALGPADAKTGVPATVVESRSLGPVGLVRLRVAGAERELQARIAEFNLPRPDLRVTVRADPAMVFVFPARDR